MDPKKKKETTENIKKELNVLLNLNKKRKSALDKISKSFKAKNKINQRTKNL